MLHERNVTQGKKAKEQKSQRVVFLSFFFPPQRYGYGIKQNAQCFCFCFCCRMPGERRNRTLAKIRPGQRQPTNVMVVGRRYNGPMSVQRVRREEGLKAWHQVESYTRPDIGSRRVQEEFLEGNNVLLSRPPSHAALKRLQTRRLEARQACRPRTTTNKKPHMVFTLLLVRGTMVEGGKK